MGKIALITDSTSDLTKDILEKYNVNVLPFRIIYKDRELRDGIEISPREVYENLEEEIPTTSIPSLKEMNELYEKLINEGYTHVIGITLSSGLSGIFNALRLVSEDYSEIKSFIFDSKSISVGEGILVEEVGKMIASGLEFNEIIEGLHKVKERMKIFFVVDTLEYLKKGGRIGNVSGTIGELLKIKPIISVGKDGKYTTFDKVRGRKQSLRKLLEIGKDMINKDYRIFLVDGYARKETETVFEELREYSESIKKGEVTLGGSISPVSGVHSGPGLIGLGGLSPV